LRRERLTLATLEILADALAFALRYAGAGGFTMQPR
jgi:hypothetical protein